MKASSLLTLIYNIRAYFKTDKQGAITGLNLKRSDLDSAVKPDNVIVGQGVKRIVVGTTPPADPQVGDIWIDTSS